MLPASALLALLLVPGEPHVDTITTIMPGSPEHGDWVPFYTRDLREGRLQYFYDRSQVRRIGDRVMARWKILGIRDASITLHVLEIECRAGTYTERGTVRIDAGGRARELPRAELWVDEPIHANSSADTFRHLFCQ